MYKVQYTYGYRNVDFWDNLTKEQAIELVYDAKRASETLKSWHLWFVSPNGRFDSNCRETLEVRRLASQKIEQLN